ncbi:hypothetical protein [Caulobacter segnis]
MRRLRRIQRERATT